MGVGALIRPDAEFDIKRAYEIGKGGKNNYILSTCPVCGIRRYVFLRLKAHARIYAKKHCAKCNPRIRGSSL